MKFVSNKEKSLPYIKYLIILIPAIIYFINVWRYAVNIPSNDDYQAILDFLCKYRLAGGAEKISLLFSQHNEHRIFSSRVVYVVYDALCGGVNFRNIIFIGNTQLLIIFYVLLRLIKRCVPQYWFIASFVAGLCLFDLSGWENADFAMAGMQNYGIFLWLLLGLYFYSLRGKKNTIAGLIFQLVAIYSSGNGIIAAGVIALFTILSGNRARMIVSIGAVVVFGPLYFVHYSAPATGHPSMNVPAVMSYFCRSVGAHMIIDSVPLGIGVGVVVLLLLALLFPITKKLRIPNEILPLACFAIFILLSLATVALFRSNVAGVPANSSRYLIYPHLLVMLVFIFMLYRFVGRKQLYPVGVCYALLLLLPYRANYKWGTSNLAGLKDRLLSAEYNLGDKSLAKRVTDEACRQGIYCIGQWR